VVKKQEEEGALVVAPISSAASGLSNQGSSRAVEKREAKPSQPAGQPVGSNKQETS
jgi:hypothetical protein